jgi:AAA ATPase domain
MTGPRVIDAASLLEREHELDALDGALAAAAGGAGEIVLVHGPAGAGKTRLVAHARAAAGSQGCSCSRRAGPSSRRASPSGTDPTRSVRYTAPGPRQAQPVLNALRDPRTVTYVRPR